MMRKQWPETLTHQLIGDQVTVVERLECDDTQSNRRELIRTTFSAIEGLIWNLKQTIVTSKSTLHKMTIHEQAALLEESYILDERGRVRVQPRFLPLAASLRLIVGIVKRYRPAYELDLTHIGWQKLLKAIDARNRIVHPKRLEDLTVSDEDVADCIAGFSWFLAYVIEIREEHVKYTKEQTGTWHARADAPSASTD